MLKRFRNFQPEEENRAEVNMSPLVDMVFLLLIFFMVSAVFVRETGLHVQKPLAASAESIAGECIMLVLTAEGRIVHDGREIAPGMLGGVVRNALAARPGAAVVILADASSPSGLLVRAIDICRLAGARDVSIAAERHPSP